MKRKITAIITVAVVAHILLFLLLVLFFSFNGLLLAGMTRSFQNGIRRSDAAVELLDVESVCGKLNGNGNGMNYFGAALVKADSVEDMEILVTELEGDFETVEYTIQEGFEIQSPYLEHRKLTFDGFEFREDESYYCICFYVHEHPASNIFDIRGY